MAHQSEPTMNKPDATLVLLRKDSRLILPLVQVAAISILLCNAILFVFWQYAPAGWGLYPRAFVGLSVFLWVLAPGLVAFGAAAMLVGTEEDGGTLLWLRSLPVSWQRIAGSKLIVALLAFAFTWGFATVVLWLLSHGWEGRLRPTAHDQFLAASSFLFFELLLLLLGFFVAYFVRNPLLGLLLLLPITFAAGITFVLVGEKLGLITAGGQLSLGAVLFALGLLVACGLLQHAASRRRLAGPLPQRGSPVDSLQHNSSYYLPPLVGIHSKPSPTASLLWQQVRQTAPLGSLLIVTSVVLMIPFLTTLGDPSGLHGWLILLAVLGPACWVLTATWMGTLVFYWDNQHRHYEFLAERGVSPTKVWWTRMLPPVCGYLILLSITIGLTIAFGIGSSARTDGIWQLMAMTTVLFAFAQLVSQWIRRPILAFMAAPAYAVACLLPMVYVLEEMRFGSFATMILAVPILLFASWRLTRPWLEGQHGPRQVVQATGYTLLAIAVPCLAAIGGRVMSTAWSLL